MHPFDRAHLGTTTGDEGGMLSSLPSAGFKSSARSKDSGARVILLGKLNRKQQKVPRFLTSVGSATYGTVRNLIAPTNAKHTFLRYFRGLNFEPKPLIIAERFHFHRQNQASCESIATYVSELRHLASNCEVKAYLEEALRDWLVCGLLSETI